MTGWRGGRLRREQVIPFLQVAGAAVSLVVALYLAAVKLGGALPACGPIKGCEDVALSEYSEIFGFPVAILGSLYSAVLLGSILASRRFPDRRLLYAVYALGLFGVVFVAYLTYLELFVIHAICIWCVTYAISIVVTFLATALALRANPG